MAATNLIKAGTYVLKQSKDALAIHEPVIGQSGIYQVYDTVGNTFPAYCEMSADGGFWILVAQWTNSPGPTLLVSFAKGMQKGLPISGYSNNPGSFPAIPAGKFPSNPATEWLLKDENIGWKALYGDWQRGKLFESTRTSIPSGEPIPVVTPLGNKTLYGPRSGWYLPTVMTYGIGFWTIEGPGGPCGGAGTSGSSRICPIMEPTHEAHADYTAIKRYFVRASNAPAR